MPTLLRTPVRTFFSALILLAVANLAAADEINFELQIRPLLTKHCGSCHGAETQKSGLRLDAKSFAFRGGDGGPVINPGKPESSSLIERITSDDPGLRMPPEGPALPLLISDFCVAGLQTEPFGPKPTTIVPRLLILDWNTGPGNPSKRHRLRLMWSHQMPQTQPSPRLIVSFWRSFQNISSIFLNPPIDGP